MINERDVYTHEMDESEPNLLPPRFDEEASAHAQPVQPLPESRLSAFRSRLAFLRHAVGTKSGAFALVVIAGLMTGTLSGMALVKVGQVTEASPMAGESVSEVAPSPNLFSEEPGAEVVGVQEMRIVPEHRIRRNPSRFRSRPVPRAYLVDVLRR
jgi:hypothetical protein